MTSFVKRIFKTVYSSHTRSFIRITTLLTSHIKPKLILAYDARKVRDGAGAQLHRILSLSLVSYLFHVRMIQPRIEDITIHPLDPVQDPVALQSYLEVWNQRLFSSNKFIQQPEEFLGFKIRYIDSLKLRSLLFLCILSKFSKDSIVVFTKESHSISDYCVEEYGSALRLYFKDFLALVRSQHRNAELIIHYRQGSGGFAIHPGQNIPRQVSIESVRIAIESVSSATMERIKRVRLFTDSPAESFRYNPLPSQLYLWKDMPGFDGKSVVNESSGVEEKLRPTVENRKLLFMVDRSLDAFQMIVAMARAEALIISRSSLSYVGALFNQDGEVYYPNGFWHTKLKRWRTYR